MREPILLHAIPPREGTVVCREFTSVPQPEDSTLQRLRAMGSQQCHRRCILAQEQRYRRSTQDSQRVVAAVNLHLPLPHGFWRRNAGTANGQSGGLYPAGRPATCAPASFGGSKNSRALQRLDSCRARERRREKKERKRSTQAIEPFGPALDHRVSTNIAVHQTYPSRLSHRVYHSSRSGRNSNHCSIELMSDE